MSDFANSVPEFYDFYPVDQESLAMPRFLGFENGDHGSWHGDGGGGRFQFSNRFRHLFVQSFQPAVREVINFYELFFEKLSYFFLFYFFGLENGLCERGRLSAVYVR